jgi:hypothetical protein
VRLRRRCRGRAPSGNYFLTTAPLFHNRPRSSLRQQFSAKPAQATQADAEQRFRARTLAALPLSGLSASHASRRDL